MDRGSESHRSIDYSRSIIILADECRARARERQWDDASIADRSIVRSPVGKWFDNQFNNAYPHTRRELGFLFLDVDDCFSLLSRFRPRCQMETY